MNDIKRMKEKKAAALARKQQPMPQAQRAMKDDGPSRGVVVGFVFVIVLVLAGLYVVQTMIDTARIQDCAASGRRDC